MGFEFDFERIEAFKPTQRKPVLRAGAHVVTIDEVENAISSGGFPMLRLTLSNSAGMQWDYVTINPAKEFTLRRVAGLVDAADLPRPKKGDFDPATGRLADSYVRRLQGRKVGIVVQDEPDNRPDHLGEMRPRVVGYLPPVEVNADLPVESPAVELYQAAVTADDDDIPF